MVVNDLGPQAVEEQPLHDQVRKAMWINNLVAEDVGEDQVRQAQC